MNARNLLSRWCVIAIVCAATSGAAVTPALVAAAASPGPPNFGSNVHIFSPAMTQSRIQATLDSVSSVQVNNQFGTHRSALLFEPGTYGSPSNPLVFQVGYYTSVAGLGLSPNEVVINGAIVSFNQCFGSCTGLNNFWRAISNLTLNIKLPPKPPAYAPAPPEKPPGANPTQPNDSSHSWALPRRYWSR